MPTIKKYGIDVSAHQGTIDWATVKTSGLDWVILRAGYGFSTIDNKFVENITGAIAAGITDIGIYWFSYAGTVEHIAEEAASCLATIAPYRESITLPVFFDWEGASMAYVQDTYGFTPTAAQIRALATAWCNAVTAAGYYTGIYSNKSDATNWFFFGGQYLWQALNVEYWYARYGANDETNLFTVPAFEEIAKDEHPEMNIFQFSDVGIMGGINSNRVDLNIRYEQSVTPEPEPEPVPEESTPTDNIDILEVRDDDFTLLAIIDTAKSVIWDSVYYGVGDFEIYIRASRELIGLLSEDRYITRENNIEVGIIESVRISDNVQDGMMLTVSGRFAKSILDRRHICRLSGKMNKATTLTGNVETAIRKLVTDNAISCSWNTNRNIGILELGATAGITKIIVDSDGDPGTKQVSYQNLLGYTEEVLLEYKLGSRAILNSDASKLQYVLYQGADRSADNTHGNAPVIFSKDFDNLTSSDYEFSNALFKNAVLIGGAGEDVERFYATIEPSATGLDRREMWVDAKAVNKTYYDAQDVEHTYTDAEYTKVLRAYALADLAENDVIETFSGTLDITNGSYVLNRDFALGDVVTIQNADIGVYMDVRITKVIEVQDENGYSVEIEYESEA